MNDQAGNLHGVAILACQRCKIWLQVGLCVPNEPLYTCRVSRAPYNTGLNSGSGSPRFLKKGANTLSSFPKPKRSAMEDGSIGFTPKRSATESGSTRRGWHPQRDPWSERRTWYLDACRTQGAGSFLRAAWARVVSAAKLDSKLPSTRVAGREALSARWQHHHERQTKQQPS